MCQAFQHYFWRALHGNPNVTCVKPKPPRHEHDILIEMNSINQILKIISYYFFLITKKWVEKGDLSWFLPLEVTSKALSIVGLRLGTSTAQTHRS